MSELSNELRHWSGRLMDGDYSDATKLSDAILEGAHRIDQLEALNALLRKDKELLYKIRENITAQRDKLTAVYEAVLPLHLSGTHVYDLDIKLGEAIKAVSDEDNHNR